MTDQEDELKTARSLLKRKRIEKQLSTRHAYRQLFLNDDGKLKPEGLIVLRDLARYCYATKGAAKMSPKSGMIDPYATHIADGRREVHLRIVNQINVDDAVFNRLITQYYEETDL